VGRVAGRGEVSLEAAALTAAVAAAARGRGHEISI